MAFLWKREHRGKTKYEMARRLLRATYSLRDAFAYVRAPIMLAQEIESALQRIEDEDLRLALQEAMSCTDRTITGQQAAYDDRMKA